MSSLQVIPEGYKQTEVGIIPEDWDVKIFGQVMNIRHGKDQKSVQVTDGLYPIFGTGGQMGTTNTPLYDKPSVLIGRKGTINKPRFMDTPFWTVDTLFYSEVSSKDSAKFIYYKFCMIDWMQYNEASGVPSLNASTIESVFNSFPKLEEQTVIANALSDVDALLAELEKLIAKKQAIKTATMQQLLIGKTRLPQFATYTDGEKQGQTKGTKPSELGEIPEDWDVARMGDISNVNQGLQIEIEQRKSYQSEISKPYITIQSLKLTEPTEFIDEYSSAVCCVEDEILMTRTGNTGIVVTGVTGVFHNNFFKIVYQKSKLNKDFFVCFLRSSDSKKRILDKAGTSTIPDLNHNDFYSLPIILPSKNEQTAIATILSDMDEEIQALKQRLSKTRQIKQGMMQELLTGKTRLPFEKTNMKSQGEPHAD
ncbi:restriction endonuclease subunit S [Vibrio pectenicida]|uniref:Restriction endonuclease subunit S n=1 Tax=Vibrio pectenicida TaxID=62763 RepID=A0A3R9F814_9VIBR|nr:restriction endonuclease subunit S [Vibrio pectenicida]RSD31003.1 restriction endonuclease subunit S [Vibrio pectenicida]